MASSEARWLACLDAAQAGTVEGLIWRVVESQEEVATSSLVDSLAEQAVLEQLLEFSKPPRVSGSDRLHYLLATPFRYPPLRWGSRFGRRFETGLFYGSKRPETALAETAFYRLLFWDGMATPPAAGSLRSQHLVFSARYRCDPGLRLQAQPFAVHVRTLRDRQRYRHTQILGSLMRERGIEGFEYVSARCPERGLNVALFTPAALVSRKPLEQQRWICEVTPGAVMFSGQQRLLEFKRAGFEVGGRMPMPA